MFIRDSNLAVHAAGVATACLMCLTANATLAADDAGMNKPLICAATEATQCQETETCVQGPATVFNLPVFFRINFQDKIAESIREGGERRTSRISKVEKNGGAIVISEQGDVKRAIGVYGDPINIAARMEQKAKELKQVVILSSEIVENAGDSGFDFDYLGEETIKGITGPIQVYTVRGIRQ